MHKDTAKKADLIDKDLLKVLHYGLIALHNHDLTRGNDNETK